MYIWQIFKEIVEVEKKIFIGRKTTFENSLKLFFFIQNILYFVNMCKMNKL